jgi:mono/diheme cytochrome c family protein
VSRRLLLAPLIALAIAGCGNNGGGSGEGAVEADLPGDADSRGGQLVTASGCLGCHKLAEAGNSGPGPDLTQIGSRLSVEEIEEVLVNPEPPMPSFADMPEDDRAAIGEYLASLK